MDRALGKDLRRKSGVLLFVVINLSNIAQTIFSIDYYLWETLETKKFRCPTLGTMRSIRRKPAKYLQKWQKLGVGLHTARVGGPGGLEGGNENFALATGEGGVGS